VTLETKPDVNDFVILARMTTSTCGITTVRTNQRAYDRACEMVEQIKRHVDNVSDTMICVEKAEQLHFEEVGQFNKAEWE
jgi:hypothetical protein